MGLFKDNLRVWWQKPADQTKRDLNREVSMLELFYDLVYVAIIIQLTHLVAGHISLQSVLSYMAIFLMMFWAWLNGSLYHDLHGNHDLKSRVVLFVQMLCLIGMGIFIHSAFAEGHRGFAFFYGLFLTVVTVLWWRAGVHHPAQRVIAKPFAVLLGTVAVAFFISIVTPATVSYAIWFISILLSLLYTMFFMLRPNEGENAEQFKSGKAIGQSFVERFGLIATLILGEGITSIVGGSTHIHHWGAHEILNVVGCFVLLASIWWVYFDFISRRLPKDNDLSRTIWIGLHFPLLASLGFVSAGVLNLLEYAEVFTLADKLILIIPLTVFLLCAFVIMENIQVLDRYYPIYSASYLHIFIAIAGLVLIAFLPVGKTATLWLIIACLFAPILSSLTIWIRVQSQEMPNPEQDEIP